ncbi:hypothetical protein HYX16_03350 [Candidatus Woesearchaeota archaeon]|nr:hypothetical protein [Candidatus Woesearchaeota archaeon]
MQKDVFWKAGIFTLIVFISGVLLGYFLENSRIDEIREEYRTVESQWADVKIQSSFYRLVGAEFCDESIKENLAFADRVYEEGLKLEKYEEASKLSNEIVYEKQKYVLLKLEFWLNSVYLKEKCSSDYTNLIYFYAQKPDLRQKADQETQSLILRDLKNKYGSNLMLIPLPIDINIATINILKKNYNVTNVPTLLINEKIKLAGVYSIKEIEKEMKNAM